MQSASYYDKFIYLNLFLNSLFEDVDNQSKITDQVVQIVKRASQNPAEIEQLTEIILNCFPQETLHHDQLAARAAFIPNDSEDQVFESLEKLYFFQTLKKLQKLFSSNDHTVKQIHEMTTEEIFQNPYTHNPVQNCGMHLARLVKQMELDHNSEFSRFGGNFYRDGLNGKYHLERPFCRSLRTTHPFNH